MAYRTALVFQPLLFLIDLLGYVVFFWLRFRTLGEPRRILLIRLEHVGDVLMTTPAILALRRRFPRAAIDVLVRDFTAPILKQNRNISKVIIWNAPWLSKLGKRESWLSVPRMIGLLRKQKYDLAIDFHGDPRNIILASLVARYRVGFGARGLGFLLNRVVPYGCRHAIDRSLSLVKALGADGRDRTMELAVSGADARFAKRALTSGVRWACIAPGSGRAEKNWLPERWAAVADRLIERRKVRVVFTGSKNEAFLVEKIVQQMKHPEQTLSLCGRTNLPQLAAILKRCSLVLCPDSGTMHIARAVGTPLVGLFTVEDPREWGYDEPRYQSVRGKDISVETVLKKAAAVCRNI
jgi:ADP-heptose:LPS heptosyltransferase